MVGWSGTTVLGGTVNLGETANTDSFAEVDVTGVGSGTNVVPVDGLRWEFVGRAGLDSINPTFEREITLAIGYVEKVCAVWL